MTLVSDESTDATVTATAPETLQLQFGEVDPVVVDVRWRTLPCCRRELVLMLASDHVLGAFQIVKMDRDIIQYKRHKLNTNFDTFFDALHL